MADLTNKNQQPAAVNYFMHPLTSEGLQSASVEPGITIIQALKNANYPLEQFDCLMVWVNGEQIEDYENYFVYHGDIINVRPVVKGKNAAAVLSAVAAVVISIYAPYLAPYLWGSQLAAGIAAGALIYGATRIIYAAFPPPEPQEVERRESYLLASTRNRKREFESLPLIIGKLRVAPDVASAMFGRFENNEQTVNQVFHFGLQPTLTLEGWRIGDTPLEDFSKPPVITMPDAQGNLPPQFNDTEVIQGGEIKNADGPFVVTTQPGSIGIEVDVQAIAYDVGSEGNIKNRNMSFTIAVFDVSDNSVAYSEDHVIGGDKINERRETYSTGTLPKGQYRIEITKNSEDKNTSNNQRQLSVVAIKSIQEDNTDYTNQLRVGLTIEASSQLTGSLDQVTALAYDSIPVFSNNSWTIAPTDNPAWWLLWFARGKRDGQGKLLFGGGLSDSQLDIESIIQFAAWCDRKKLTCGMFLNKDSTVRSVLNAIARCGRGEITWGKGKLGVIWDDDQAVPVAVFGPGNIRANTFAINYDANKTADEVIVNFLNKDNDYKPDSVRVTVGDTVSPERPTQFQFQGCLDADMAGREARLIAAAQQELRRTITWETDIEGVVVKRGDVVLLSHDIVGWSESGRVVSGLDRQSFFVDKDLKFSPTGFIGLRSPNGRYETFKIDSINGREVVLKDAPPADFLMPGETDSPALDWMWFYDIGGKPGRAVRITDVVPKDRNTLAFTAKDYSAEYFKAETGEYIHKPVITAPKPIGNLIPGVFAWETYRIDGDRRTQVLALSWSSISSVNQYTAKIWNTKAGGEQSITTEVSGARFDVLPGIYNYRITGNDVLTSQVYSAVGTITITGAADVAQVKEFRAEGVLGAIILRWEYPDNAVNMRFVRIKATYTKGGTSIIENFQEAYPINSLTHSGLDVAQRVDYELVLVDAEGNESEPVTVSAITSDNISQIIDAIEGELDESALSQDLKDRIDKIENVETTVENLQTSTNNELADIRNNLATAEQDLKNQLSQTNTAVSKAQTEIDATKASLEAAKQESQQGINEAKTQINQVNTTLTQGVNDAKAEVDQVKNDLAAAVEQEQQNNEQLKTELTALIATSGVKTFSQQTEPTEGMKSGDIWFKEDADGNVIDVYRFHNGVWELSSHADIEANAAAIINEQNVRASADAALGQRIDTVTAKTNQNAAAISTEATARTTADSALSARIDTVTAKAADNEAAITQEATTRADADSALGSRIDSVTAKTAQNTAAITSEATARTTADEALSSRIDSVNAKTNKNATDISQEVTARTNADSALGRRIDTISTKTDQNSAAISSEETARAAADGALGMRIDQVKASAESNAEEAKRLDAAITAEQTARADGDTALGSRIDTVSATVTDISGKFENFDFEDGLNNWSSDYSSQKPLPANTTIEAELGEGNVMQVFGGRYVYGSNFIKVDTSRKYKMRVTARQVVAPTNGDEKNRFYAGFVTFDYLKEILIGGPGWHRYFVVQARPLLVEDGWQTFEGTITGEGNDSHNQFRENTAYVKPMLLLNYSGGDGAVQIAKVEIWDATGEVDNAAEITTEKTARADADSALGQRIDTVSAKAAENETLITQEVSARSTADEALGQRIDSVKATAENANNTATQNQAAITAEQTARADGDSALGSRIEMVSAQLGKIEHTADNWDFERGTDGWVRNYNGKEPTGQIVGGTKLEDGVGSVYYANEFAGAWTKRAIKIIDGDTYRVGFKVRQKEPSTNSDDPIFYAGVAALDSKYQRIGNNIYNAASQINLQNDNDWKYFSAEFEASDLPDGTRYIRPMFFGNYPRANGEFQVSYVSLENITDQKRIESLVKTEETARVSADSALGQRIDTVNATLQNKADNTDLNALANRVTTAETTLDGKASASEVATVKSSVTTLFDNDAADLGNSIVFNSRFGLRNADLRPAGWYPAHGSTDFNTIGYADDPQNNAFLDSLDRSGAGMASTAFALNAGSQYTIRAKVKAQTAADSGFYLRVAELDSELPVGKKAINAYSVGSPETTDGDRYIYLFAENEAITTEWQTVEFNYTPTDSARFASIVLLNWSGMGRNNPLFIEFCDVIEVPAKSYVDAQIKTVNETIANTDKAMAERVTTVESSITTKADEARDQAIEAMNARGNLLEKYLAGWKVGNEPADTGMRPSGEPSENRFVEGLGPYGTNVALWEAIGDGGEDGGMLADFELDTSKSYRYSIFVKQTQRSPESAADARIYSRVRGGSLNLDGTDARYDYPIADFLPEKDKWYLMVSALYSNGTTSSPGLTGFYDLETGEKVVSGTDLKSNLAHTVGQFGAFTYYTKDPTQKTYFFGPRVDVMDGTEPSLTSLMPNLALNALGSADRIETELTAKIEEVETTLVTKEEALAKRIDDLNTQVTNKADNTTVNALANRVTQAESSIEGKASASEVATLKSSVETLTDNGTDSPVRNYIDSEIETVNQTLTTQERALSSRIDSLNASLSDKADNTDLSALVTRVTQAETEIDGKASASELNSLKSSVGAIENTGNLLSKYLEKWKSGAHPADLGMGLNGAADENSFTTDLDPFGAKNTIWKMQTNSDTSFDGDGGFTAGNFNCDSDKTYRFAIYAKQSSMDGTFYLGAAQNGPTLNLDGSVINNPYFHSGDLPEVNKWYLIIGYLRPSSARADSGKSGVYDLETGKKVIDGQDFKMKPGITSQYMRAYWYYSKDANAKAFFFGPRVDVVNGNEPSLTSLLPNAAENISDRLTASINTLNQTIATGDQAVASQVTQLESSVNNKTVQLEQSLTTTANKVGGLESKYSVKVDNNGYVSGFGLLSTENDGEPTSEFAIRADKFYIAAPAGSNYDGGTSRYPFIVQNGKVYIRNANIADGAIGSAKIANVIQSTNYRKGQAGWQLNKAGPSEFNDDVVVNATVNAAKIVGDIVSSIKKTIPSKGRTWRGRTSYYDVMSVRISNPRPYPRVLIIDYTDFPLEINNQLTSKPNRMEFRFRLFHKEASKTLYTYTGYAGVTGSNPPYNGAAKPPRVYALIPANTNGTIYLQYANFYSDTYLTWDARDYIVQLFKDSGEIS